MFFRINNKLDIQCGFRQRGHDANLCDIARLRLMGGASNSSARVHVRKMLTGRKNISSIRNVIHFASCADICVLSESTYFCLFIAVFNLDFHSTKMWTYSLTRRARLGSRLMHCMIVLQRRCTWPSKDMARVAQTGSVAHAATSGGIQAGA
jgi:hypothetical protein